MSIRTEQTHSGDLSPISSIVKRSKSSPPEAGTFLTRKQKLSHGVWEKPSHRRKDPFEVSSIISELEDLCVYSDGEYSPKEFSRSKRDRKKNGEPADLRKQNQTLRKKNKALQEKLRAKGRQLKGKRTSPSSGDMQPESLFWSKLASESRKALTNIRGDPVVVDNPDEFDQILQDPAYYGHGREPPVSDCYKPKRDFFQSYKEWLKEPKETFDRIWKGTPSLLDSFQVPPKDDLYERLGIDLSETYLMEDESTDSWLSSGTDLVDKFRALPKAVSSDPSLLIARFTGYLAAVSTASDFQSAMAITVGVAAQHLTGNHLKCFEQMLKTYTMPESYFGTMVSGIQQFRGMLHSMEETPGYQMIMQGMLVISYFGVMPSSFCKDGSLFHQFALDFEKNSRDIQLMTFMDAFASITEYAMQFMDVITSGGDVVGFLMPKTIAARYAIIMSRKNDYFQGRLEETCQVLDHDYVGDVKQLRIDLDRMVARKSTPQHLRTAYTAYYTNVLALENDVEAHAMSHSMRERPGVITMYSKSRIGKSGLIMDAIGTYAKKHGLPFSEDMVYFFKDGNKYQDGLTHKHLYYVMDDCSQQIIYGKVDENSMTALCVEVVNNVPVLSSQASIESKGKIFLRPKLLVITTNDMYLQAQKISIHPRAIWSRMEFVEVRVKTKYADKNGELDNMKLETIDGVTVPAHEMKRYDLYTNKKGIIRVDREDWIPSNKMFALYGEMWLQNSSSQKEYINRMNLVRTVERCDGCGQPKGRPWCVCDPEPVKPEILDYILGTDNVTANRIVNALAAYHPRQYFPRVIQNYLSRLFLYLIYQILRDVPRYGIGFRSIAISCAWVFALMPCFAFVAYCHPIVRVMIAIFVISLIQATFAGLVRFAQRAICRRLRSRYQNSYHQTFPVSSYALSILGVIYSIRMISKHFRKVSPEGNINPVSMDDVRKRNEEEDPWKELELTPVPTNHKLSSMTANQVINATKSNFVFFDVIYPDGEHAIRGAATMFGTGTIAIPKHAYVKIKAHYKSSDVFPITIIRNPKSTSSSLSCYSLAVVEIDYLDMVLIRISSRLPVMGLERYLPETRPKAGSARMVVRRLDDTGFINNVWFDAKIHSNGFLSCFGARFTTRNINQPGDCMSPVISLDKPHHIIGFHMGSTGQGEAVCHTLLLPQFEKAMALLEKKSIVSKDASDMIKPESDFDEISEARMDELWNKDPMGNIFMEPDPELHPRSCARFLKDDPNEVVPPCIDVYGEFASSRTRPKSSVKRTPLSPHLEAHGIPCHFGPPIFESNRNHADYFQIGARGCLPFDPMLVRTDRKSVV